MKFRTEISVKSSPGLVGYDAPTLFIGSCFSDNISAKLSQRMMDVVSNPTGQLYNPVSIRNLLQRLVAEEPYTEADLFRHNGLWHSFDHHSRFSSDDISTAVDHINREAMAGFAALKNARTIFITLGSSIAFKRKEDGKVVANCHKLPDSVFERVSLSVNDCTNALQHTLRLIHQVNHDAHVVFTISPIRHTGYGHEANSLSKATLRVAVDEIIKTHPNTDYFPAYEIMLDDLRDYRFYASDMKHPSDVAIDYIFDKFAEAYFDRQTAQIAEECLKLTTRRKHRHFGMNTAASEAFEKSTEEMAEMLASKYPFLREKLILPS